MQNNFNSDELRSIIEKNIEIAKKNGFNDNILKEFTQTLKTIPDDCNDFDFKNWIETKINEIDNVCTTMNASDITFYLHKIQDTLKATCNRFEYNSDNEYQKLKDKVEKQYPGLKN